MIKIHKDSHLDHDVPWAVREYVLEKFADQTEFFVETIEYPEKFERLVGPTRIERQGAKAGDRYSCDLPPIPCALHLEVPESEVFYAKRGDRQYDSRMCKRPPRMVREVTIVAGIHPEEPEAGMVLFTMYGGPAAPQEPGDPKLAEEKRASAEAFWGKAALSEDAS